ncbi:PQQ-binding-like beta-propeller repeat protein [Archangium violaceum]|uniref:PQQ-binding-like beta-propeller repeat protein n=1 Tax=Archangium violaceum TaxID=83451 RepID=UPI00194ED053|nr:PQQ-binding-like beta-propeller repeat protein [Archangium violaceum]QRO02273.1 PQQ-binding-like beta-propeller repeat protein [Archangium violaceum]
MNARPLALLLLLLPATALAQNAWTVTPVDGTAVMGEISSLVFEVRNASTSTRPLNEISLAVDGAAYDVDGGDAPAGWTVSTIDRKERRITYTASGSCTPGPLGLAPGTAARFTLRLVGLAANADATDALVGGNNPNKSSMARDSCSGTTFNGDPSTASWKRAGLSASLTVLPRTLQLGGVVSVQLQVVNRSLATQGNITLSGPGVVGGASFNQTVAFSPASLSLAPGATGAFTGKLQSTGEGTAVFQASAGNGTVSTATTSSLQVIVSSFPALLEVLPSSIAPGDTVTVRLVVSNPSTSTYRNVVPSAPTFTGTAVPSLLSSPMPASAASLGPGSSVSFLWKYQMNGPIGSTFQFGGQADATRDGAPISTGTALSAQGRIVEHRLSIAPSSVISGARNRTLQYTIYNGGTVEIRSVRLLTPDATFFTVSPSAPFASDTSGWTQSATNKGYTWTALSGQPGITPGTQKTFSIDYASFGTVSSDTALTHQLELTQVSGSTSNTLRVDAPVSLFVNRMMPEVDSLVALAGPGRNTLLWTNPSEHDGVLVLRAEGLAPNTAPEPGRRYAVGETLGNATVVYSDELSVASTYADTGVTDGTVYFYRVYNHDPLYRYSPGNAPQSLGLKSVPTSRGTGQPLWCYSVGFSTLQQPITELGVGIFTANTSGSVTANLTNTSTPVADGSERWRPVRLQGSVQSRFPIVPLYNRPGQYILTGDQAGFTYAIRTETGELLWRSTSSLGTIQSFPVVQLFNTGSTNQAYKDAFPGKDLAFFATRLSTGTTNQVVALEAATGAPVWTYSPGDLGMVSGGMLIDYTTNRLYMGARSNGGSLASLRVLDSLTGTELARLSLGDIDFGIIRYGTNLALVTNSDGKVYGIDMTAMTVAWSASVASRPSASVPAFSQYARPVGGGFVVSILGATDALGRVERWSVTTDATGATSVTRVWSTPIPSPSGTFSFTSGGVQRLYVGGKDEKVHELDYTTGVDGKQVSLPGALAVGTPTVDSTVSRLHVGTQDGRICAFPVPFP